MTDRYVPIKGDGTFPTLVNTAINALITSALTAVRQVSTGGTSGQVLTKGTGSTYTWADAPSGGGGGSALPTGGTTGQVLTKNSTTNGDAGWATPSGGGGGGGAAETPIYDVRSWITNTTMAATGSDSLPNTFQAYRVGHLVTLVYDCIADGVSYAVFAAPTGWRPSCSVAAGLSTATQTYLETSIVLDPTGAGRTAGARRRGTLSYICMETATATGTVVT